MKYRLQKVDLEAFLRDQIPHQHLAADLRQRIRHALRQGGDLGHLAALATRELLAANLLRPYGTLGKGEQRVLLYCLPGSSRVYDLRSVLDASASNANRTPSVPDPTVSPTPARRNGDPSFQLIRVLRETLRRDWISFGVEIALEGLLRELRSTLQDDGAELHLLAGRLGSPLGEGKGWKLLWDSDERASHWARLFQAEAATKNGLAEDGQRWLPVHEGRRLVGVFGASPQTSLELHRQATGAISDLLSAFLRSQERVHTDALTGVQNRASFEQQLALEMERARRGRSPLAILFTDLDHFKRVNDEYGHDSGDKVLRHVAQLFKRHLRRLDHVFRWGGEEFALLLPGANLEVARATAERLRARLEESSIPLDGAKVAEIRVTMSIGVAIYPDNASAAAELLKRVDQALYAAKSGGRNQVACWSELQSSRGQAS